MFWGKVLPSSSVRQADSSICWSNWHEEVCQFEGRGGSLQDFGRSEIYWDDEGVDHIYWDDGGIDQIYWDDEGIDGIYWDDEGIDQIYWDDEGIDHIYWEDGGIDQIYWDDEGIDRIYWDDEGIDHLAQRQWKLTIRFQVWQLQVWAFRAVLMTLEVLWMYFNTRKLLWYVLLWDNCALVGYNIKMKKSCVCHDSRTVKSSHHYLFNFKNGMRIVSWIISLLLQP
jgi:hypothetical protein